jgi:hypothetical protein
MAELREVLTKLRRPPAQPTNFEVRVTTVHI